MLWISGNLALQTLQQIMIQTGAAVAMSAQRRKKRQMFNQEGGQGAPFQFFDWFLRARSSKMFETGCLQIWDFSTPSLRPASREQFLAHLSLNWGPALLPGSLYGTIFAHLGLNWGPAPSPGSPIGISFAHLGLKRAPETVMLPGHLAAFFFSSPEETLCALRTELPPGSVWKPAGSASWRRQWVPMKSSQRAMPNPRLQGRFKNVSLGTKHTTHGYETPWWVLGRMISPHNLVLNIKGEEWFPCTLQNRNFAAVFDNRNSFSAKGLHFVAPRWHCFAP